MNLDGPVLVTGANSGIGLAIVSALLDGGLDVVGTVRSDRADRVVRRAVGRSDHLTVARLDVTDSDACRRVVRRHTPSVLVHNAGSVELGAVMDVGDDRARVQLETSVVGPVRLSREFVASRREREAPGRIVWISTVLTEADLPFTGWYSAAKAAADAIGDALALELRPSAIDVVRIQCGAVRTDVWDDAGDAVASGDDQSTQNARRRWDRLTRLATPLYAPPQDVASAVSDAITSSRPDAVYRVGFASRLGVVGRLVPDRIDRALTGALFGLRRP